MLPLLARGSDFTLRTRSKPVKNFFFPRFDPRIINRRRRLARLRRRGLLPDLTKSEARKLCEQAYAEWTAKNPKI
jgi:hypothetical protein